MKYSPRFSRQSGLTLLLISTAAISLSRPAFAQTPPDAKSSSGPDAGRRAQAAYDVQDWSSAIKEYRAAYQAEQKPEYLWGLAQALRMSGDCKAAVLSYKAFRRADVSANQATAAELMITRCEAELEKREAEAAKASPSPAAPVETPPASASSAAPTPHEAAPPSPVVVKPKRFYEDALGDVLFVAGAAAAGTGGYFLFKGNAQVKDGNDAETYGTHTNAVDDGKRKQTLGAIALGAGGALLVAATWRFLSFDPGPNEHVSVGLGGIDFRTQF